MYEGREKPPGRAGARVGFLNTPSGCHLRGGGSTADRIVGVGSPARPVGHAVVAARERPRRPAAAGPPGWRREPQRLAHWDVVPPFGIYVHVPFCAARCGYCDFNTYTPAELAGSGASPDGWLAAVQRELALARSVIGGRRVDTVFIGGGTPSLLGAARLGEVLEAVRATFGLAADAEVTTESNPESTSPAFFVGLAQAGFTRVSLGMQSAAPHVLRVLERRHTPGRAADAAQEARAAGLAHVNLDLIYATPGETDDDLRASLDAALAAGVDHLSAY